MKKLFLFTFLSTILIDISFGQDTVFFDSKWKECEKNNSKFYRVDKQVDDIFQRTDYYTENNQVQMIGQYTSLENEIKTGNFKWFHSNGELKHIGEYIDNKEIGKHIWYYDNGKIEAIENYKLGVLNGEYIEYYKNGNKSSESSFINGLQNGLTKYYRDNGKLHSEGNFKDGDRIGIWKFYGEDGEFLGTNEYKTDYEISEANLFLKLPNSKWTLTEKVDGELTQYYFKRSEIQDKNGISIIPAIMVFVEDATNYEQDVTLYSITKQGPFKSKGVQTDKILIQDDKDYPLTYNNAYFYECSYTSQDLEHIFYMIHIINKDNKGIQIYLDMTKSIADDYLSEFWTTIKSIKEIE